MNISPDTRSKLQVGHYITIWVFLVGLLVSMLGYANDLENEQVRADERQKELIKKIEKQESTNEAIQRQLQDNRDILIEIRTKQEAE